MEKISNHHSIERGEACVSDSLITTVECPVEGKRKARRITTTCKSSRDGQLLSVLVEEYQNEKLVLRQFNQYVPQVSSMKESYDQDGTLISAEIERGADEGRLRKICRRGSGKSATTRIVCGEVEARATERSVIIETAEASYNYCPVEGKWSSYYKNMDLKLELKSNYLKGPVHEINGPDGIKLIFDEHGQLSDMLLSLDLHKTCKPDSVPGIID